MCMSFGHLRLVAKAHDPESGRAYCPGLTGGKDGTVQLLPVRGWLMGTGLGNVLLQEALRKPLGWLQEAKGAINPLGLTALSRCAIINLSRSTSGRALSHGRLV